MPNIQELAQLLQLSQGADAAEMGLLNQSMQVPFGLMEQQTRQQNADTNQAIQEQNMLQSLMRSQMEQQMLPSEIARNEALASNYQANTAQQELQNAMVAHQLLAAQGTPEMLSQLQSMGIPTFMQNPDPQMIEALMQMVAQRQYDQVTPDMVGAVNMAPPSIRQNLEYAAGGNLPF